MKNIISVLNPAPLYEILKKHKNYVFVVSENKVAEKIKEEIEILSKYFNLNKKVCILYENKTNTLNFNYEYFVSEISNVYKIFNSQCIPVIVFKSLFKIIPSVSLKSETIKTNDILDVENLRKKLINLGYRHQIPVEEKGTFYIKGGIIDIFVPYYDNPVRIELFGDEIESIRFFDPDFQTTLKNTNEFRLTPALIIDFSDDNVKNFKKHISDKFKRNIITYEEFEHLHELVEKKSFDISLIDYLPLFYKDKTSVLKELISKSKNIFFYDLNSICQISDFLFESGDDLKIDYEAVDLFLNKSRLKNSFFYISEFENFVCQNKLTDIFDDDFLKLDSDVDLPYRIILQEPKTYSRFAYTVEKYLKEGKKIVFFYNPEEKRKKIEKILNDFNLVSKNIFWVKGVLKSAFKTKEEVFLSDYLVLGGYLPPISRKKRKKNTISSFNDLSKGDYVVHSLYGIGRYEGIKEREINNTKIDFIEISYAKGDKLFLPVYNMSLLYKHSSKESRVKLDRFGSKAWENRKKRIKKSIERIAEELIELYGQRMKARGFAFSENDELYEVFASEFPYVLTKDQENAINEVIKDMEDVKPMDRLVCGDVGFGKTEVAMRAAFKAVSDGKQVVLLTPTTVLAFQHYLTFKERFKNFPVEIDFISSFKTLKQKKEILNKLENGKIDILIGTQAVLNKSLSFKTLGLLIIDEEHKFGVKDKEKLRKMKLNIDTLTMTATPIPRTLNFSLSGIRDLSIINTPPKDRKSVNTIVLRKNTEVIKEAILNELKRGGQIFYIHNKISDLHKEAEFLLNLVPDLKLSVAHADLPKSELEKIMLNFYKGEFDLLLSTNIIESGIDIPNANTMIINNADNFGLASLYQLRGRVGRSQRQGYCLLLLPPKKNIGDTAQRRLSVISRYTDLGSGFQIALQDMEIRGAGSLLGFAQKGHIDEIGYETYMNFLKEALAKIKGEEDIDIDFRPEINTVFNSYIPAYYIDDEVTRLSFYKRFSNSVNEDEIDELANELIDRYSKFPYELENFINLLKIRLKAITYKISKINITEDITSLVLDNSDYIDFSKLLSFISKSSDVKIKKDNQIILFKKSKSLKDALIHIENVINEIFLIN